MIEDTKMTDVENTTTNGRLRPRRKTLPPTRNLRRSEQKAGENSSLVSSTSASVTFFKTSDDTTTTSGKVAPDVQHLCLYCDRNFPGKKALSKHVQRIHHLSTRKDYSIKCNFCNHVETDSKFIITHMLHSHADKYFVCSKCLHRFSSSQELQDHSLQTCHGKEPKELPYRNKLRHKNNIQAFTPSSSNPKAVSTKKIDFAGNEPLLVPELSDGSGEIKNDAIDFEESISMNLILPPCKNLYAGAINEKTPVIVLDDIQWKRKPSNVNAIQSGDRADQILSRLGVVHRSRGTETSRYWYRHIDDSNKFERCFDTNFYLKVTNNVQENLMRFLDGTFNAVPRDDEPIKTRKSKNNVVINTIEGFPTLLATGQFSRNTIDDLPRAIAPKQKWKWDNTDNDKQTATNDDLGIIKRDSHTNKCIVGLFSSLDIWTQLRMRHKHEETFKGTVTIEKQSSSSKELKEIIESRELPNTSTPIVKYTPRQSISTEGLDFPMSLGLVPSAPECVIQPAILSGECARKRCYVCCACGEQSQDPKSLASHHSIHHPHAQVNNYEIVGEELLNADILKHLYVPPAPAVKKRLPLRGSKTCTKCDRHMMAEELHQHMLECAGDIPVQRRKVRQRLFGVRRRRTRLPESTIRKQLRKSLRSRGTRPKKIIRQYPRIRTPVGDAETIKKMIADLPAKRHRVSANQASTSSRNVSRREKQIQIRMKRRPSENDKARNHVKLSHAVQRKITRSKFTSKDAKVSDSISKSSQNYISKGKIIKIKITRKTVVRKSQRKSHNHSFEKGNKAKTAESANHEMDGYEKTINFTPNILGASLTNQSIITRSTSGGNGASDSRRSGTTNESNSQSGRNPSHNSSGPKNAVPLKHSIASLTATPHVQSYHAYSHVTLSQNALLNTVNISRINPYEEQRGFIQQEEYVTKLDKPPLCPKTDDFRGNTKVKGNKPRRRLNDCIAMLKGKLGDSDLPAMEGHNDAVPHKETPVELPLEKNALNDKNRPEKLILPNANSIESVSSMKPLDLSGKSSHSAQEKLSCLVPATLAQITPICLPPVQLEPLPLVTGPSKSKQLVHTSPDIPLSNVIASTMSVQPTVASPQVVKPGLVTVVSPPKPTTPALSSASAMVSAKRSSDNRRNAEKTSPKGGQMRSSEKLSSQRPVFDPTLKIPQYKVRQNTTQENESNELPSDSTVTLLPKEIVEILGTMSVQHRNTLLNALPQVFAKTVKDLKLVVDSNVNKESLTSPNRSEIATQTMNNSSEQEFPQDFLNIDTDKFLIDPVTGTITERPEKEISFPAITETIANIQQLPRLDIIDLTAEEEDQEKKTAEKSRDVFLPPPSSKIQEVEPVSGVILSSSAVNVQHTDHFCPTPVKAKAANDKTSSLRAVRIKSANEKQKLMSANIMVASNISNAKDKTESNLNILDVNNPAPTTTLTLETTISEIQPGSMTSPAIQQAEISSTQQSSINAAKSIQLGHGITDNTAAFDNTTVLKELKILESDKPKDTNHEPETTPIIAVKLTESPAEKPSEAFDKLSHSNTSSKSGQCIQFSEKYKDNESTPLTVSLSPPIIEQNTEKYPTEKAFIHQNENLPGSPKLEESHCNSLSENVQIIQQNQEHFNDDNNLNNETKTTILDSKVTNPVTNYDDDPEDDVSLAVIVKQKKTQSNESVSGKKLLKPFKNVKKPNKESNLSLSTSNQFSNQEHLPSGSESDTQTPKIVVTDDKLGSEIQTGKKEKIVAAKSLYRAQIKKSVVIEKTEGKDDKPLVEISTFPLRRSRRGRSDYIEREPNTEGEPKEVLLPTPITVENKLPLTKKQLIFSKLLDEKKSQDLKLKDLASPKSVNVIDSDTFHGELILGCESMLKTDSVEKRTKDNVSNSTQVKEICEVEKCKQVKEISKKKTKSLNNDTTSNNCLIIEPNNVNTEKDIISTPNQCLKITITQSHSENDPGNLVITETSSETSHMIDQVNSDLAVSNNAIIVNEPNNHKSLVLKGEENYVSEAGQKQNAQGNHNAHKQHSHKHVNKKKNPKKARRKKNVKVYANTTESETEKNETESPVTSSTDIDKILDLPSSSKPIQQENTLLSAVDMQENTNEVQKSGSVLHATKTNSLGTPSIAVSEGKESKNDAITVKKSNITEDNMETSNIEINVEEVLPINDFDSEFKTSEVKFVGDCSKDTPIVTQTEIEQSHTRNCEEGQKETALKELAKLKKSSVSPLKRKVASHKSKKPKYIQNITGENDVIRKYDEKIVEIGAEIFSNASVEAPIHEEIVTESDKNLNLITSKKHKKPSLKRKSNQLNHKKSKSKKKSEREVEKLQSDNSIIHETSITDTEPKPPETIEAPIDLSGIIYNKESNSETIANINNMKTDLNNEMSFATRRTRSKSVMFKTVTATSPQDFDILVCDSELTNNNVPSDDKTKETVISITSEEVQPSPSLKKDGNKKKKKSIRNKKLQDATVTTEEIESPVEGVKLVHTAKSLITPSGSVETDSDDSSKSDLPLNKYVREISKKKTKKSSPSVTSKNRNLKQGSSRPIKNRRKTVAICGNLDSSKKSDDANDEQARSDQFMESFGFYSERKPRKSNLLAAKKIFETFHLTSNDSDDVSYKDNERVTRRNHSKETSKTVAALGDNPQEDSSTQEDTADELSDDSPPNKKKCTPEDVKNKPKVVKTYCEICKKEFRRPDNLTRHQLTLFHISNVSAIEMNLPPKTLENEPPNCLVVYRRHLENLKKLNELEGGSKLIELPSLSDILKMTNPEKYGPLTGHKVSGRDLSGDEALFYECCELLKESYKNNRSKCEPSTSGEQSHKSYLIMGPKVNELETSTVDKDEDVDSITAKEILESEEVRNLENDLISGLARAKTGLTFSQDTLIQENESVTGPYDFTSDNESKVPDIKTSRYNADKGLQNPVDSDNHKEIPHVSSKEKSKPSTNNDDYERMAAIPSTSTGIYDSMDLFEDKFDKIKRKCRSQAAAAKNASIYLESQNSVKQKKTPERKSSQKKDSNKHQRAVPTKGALKGFDGIKVSIPTSDIKLPANVPNMCEDSSRKKKKKKVRTKKTLNADRDEPAVTTKVISHTITPRNKVDVYEFMDEAEDNDALEFRPTTLSERLKSSLKENTKSRFTEPDPSEAKDREDGDDSGTSVSDGDDFVYMSDDYLCSANETETENSLMSFELGNGSKIHTESRKIHSFKRKDSIEKNAVMGKIFKNNAVRNERRNSFRESTHESPEKTNLDQLFDSLLEQKPSSSAATERADASWSIKPRDHSEEPTPRLTEHTQLSDSETGVARQRVRRKCTVGKQNILAETWSSESEQDVNYSRRPNSVESVAPVAKKKKCRKVSSMPSSTGNIRRNRHITFKDQDESRVFSPIAGQSGRSKRSRSEVAYYCSSAEEEESHTLVEQHGWIVGDSHKKLVTMLAHAKGRKRDDKRNLVE